MAHDADVARVTVHLHVGGLRYRSFRNRDQPVARPAPVQVAAERGPDFPLLAALAPAGGPAAPLPALIESLRHPAPDRSGPPPVAAWPPGVAPAAASPDRPEPAWPVPAWSAPAWGEPPGANRPWPARPAAARSPAPWWLVPPASPTDVAPAGAPVPATLADRLRAAAAR